MTRRGHGEGSLYQRADGRWCATIDLGWRNGRRVRRSFYGKTRKEAAERLQRVLRDLHQGVQPGRRTDTLAAFLRSWLEASEQRVRPSTHRRYRQIVEHQLVPAIGRIPVTQLQPSDVEAMLRALLVAPRTAHHVRAVLRTALNRAGRDGLVARNVAALADAPRLPAREVRALTPDEVRLLLRVASSQRHGGLFVVAVTTGLRQSELLGLRWPDVDLAERRVHVRHALHWRDGVAELAEPKTTRSRRSVPLPTVAVEALAALPRAGVYVFANDAGGPLHPGTAYHALQDALAAAEIPRVSFHALRHSFASALVADGVHPRVIMALLGHSQIALTMNTYAHVIPELEREAAERMDALLAK
jgi:integrase